MTIHDIPGGKVEIRDRLTVGGRELLQEEMFGLVAHIQRQIDKVKAQGGQILTRSGKPLEIETLADLNEIPSELMDKDFVKVSHAFQRAAVVAHVTAWTLPLPVPTLQNIGDLDGDVYDALCELVNPLVAKSLMGADFSPDAMIDPKAQAGNLSASNSSETASQSLSNQETNLLPNTSGNTSSDASSDSPEQNIWRSQPTL